MKYKYNFTLQVLFALSLLQPGQPFVPSLQSRIDFACFQTHLPKIKSNLLVLIKVSQFDPWINNYQTKML